MKMSGLWVLMVIGLAAGFSWHTGAEEITVASAVIVSPAQALPDQVEAARELQKHLTLIMGSEPAIVRPGEAAEGQYPFHVGFAPPDDETPLEREEARWVVSPEGAYFHGDDEKGMFGTQVAVYGFLEEQLGVRWIAPGDAGIAFKAQSPLTLRSGSFGWIPQLQFRKIRQGLRLNQPHHPRGMPESDAFRLSVEEHNARVDEIVLWQKRMRMGGARPGGGHAFSSWWVKYGESQPDLFALNKYGKREPVALPKGGAERSNSFIKICPSNPRVADRVIADWLPRKEIIQYINVGVNDGSENFCECEDCRRLDVPLEGEAWDEHLTDRYVHLANQVAREARKHREDAWVTMYAYLKTLYPPRKLKLEPNVVVQLVPYVDPLDLATVKAHVEGWKRAGAKQLSLRPNYHTKYFSTTMPLGIEKQMFDVLQLAVENDCVAAEYDSLVNNWPVTGLADYVLAKAMTDPSKPFDYWAEQYYEAFGAAADEVKRYFEYWRLEVWNQRLMPDILTISTRGGAGDFARGLFWSLGSYYRPEDFEATQAILEQAGARQLTAGEKVRLTQLQLANEHARLMYLAVVAKPENKGEFAETLTAFRLAHKDELPLQWVQVIGYEIGNGDLTGLRIGKEMQGYLKPWLPTELFWKFRLDPANVGEAEAWQKLPWESLTAWHSFRTDRTWEQQFEFDEPHNLPEETARVIFTYDGIGWYATRHAIPADWKGRRIFLRFGAVDESCWVYVNGELAGEHIYTNANDWKTPFEIQIDKQVNWNAPLQQVTVRVEDRGGMGGIWRPVWIVSKE